MRSGQASCYAHASPRPTIRPRSPPPRRLQRMASSPSDTSDLYSILGLEQSATDAQIKKAYRANALKWHPDKVAASKRDEAGDRFKRIKEAYEVLIDGDRRKVYDQYGAASLEPGFHAPPEATAEPPYPQSPVYDTPQSQPQPQEPSYPTASYPATPLNPAYYSFTQSTFPDSYPSFPYFNGVPPGTYGVPFTRTFIYDSFGNAFPFGQPMPVPQPPSMPPQNPQPGMYFTPTPANAMRFPSPHPHGNIAAGMPFGPQPVPQPPSYSTPVQSPQPQYQYSNGDYFAANRQNWMPSNPAAESPSQTPQNGSREGTPTPQAMPPRWIPQPPPQPQPPSGQRWMPQPPPQPPPGPTSLPRPPRPPQSAFPQQVPPPSYPHHPSVYPQQYMQSPPQTPPQGPNNLSQPVSPIHHLPERQWQSASQNSENPQVRPRRSSVNKLKRRSTTSDLRVYLAAQSVERGDRNSDRGKPGWRWKWPFG